MAYRRPGVKLTQVFQDVAPGLATFALPSVHVGPAYQIVSDDLVGSYSGLSVSVPYAGKVPGAIVDIAEAAEGDLLAYPLLISLEDLIVQWLASVSTGVVDAGDLRVLNDPSANVFETVEVQDKIIVTAPAELVGTYTVIEVIDENNLKVDIPFAEDAASVTYSINRNIAGPVNIPRDTAGLTIDTTQVTLPAGLTYASGSGNKDILDSEVHLRYRALRFEQSTFIKEYKDVTELQEDFGIDQIVPQNPVVYSVYLGLTNSVTASNMLQMSQEFITIPDEQLAHQKAIDILKNSEMYAINVLSQTPVVHQSYRSHVSGLSTPERKKWRVAVVNRSLKTDLLVIDEHTTGAGTRDIVVAHVNGINDGTDLDILAAFASGEFADVKVGDTVAITGGTNVTPGDYLVTELIDDEHIKVASAFATGASSNVAYSITRPYGLTADGLELYDDTGALISGGAVPGAYVKILDGSTGIPLGRFEIASVESQNLLTFGANEIDTNGATTHFTDVVYIVDRDMTLTEQAEFIRDYTLSIGSRRIVHVWPDVVKVNVANVPTQVPGYFLGASVVALTTGLPTQQGLTNLAVSGYVGVVHSSQYFDDDQLDIIAGGGSMVFAQTRLDESAVFIRHQLTTDMSAIKFQEYSVTKNVDFISFFLVRQSEPLIGQFNIYDGLFDELKLRAQKNITFLRDNTKVAQFGGVILAGKLTQLVQDPANIDGVLQTYNMTVPIPLNKLDITLVV